MRSWLTLVTLLFGCAASSPTLPPKGATGPDVEIAPSAAVAPSTEAWRTSLDREHPLVGKIWDVKGGAFVTESTLAERAATVPFVLLGERHDNPDHHRLQARVVAALVKSGRHPVIVLEMLEVEQQPAIDRYVSGEGATAEGFGAALGWEKTSWPPFAEYLPLFQVAFSAKLQIRAGNISQSDARALVRQGLAALPADRVEQLRLDVGFPPALEASLIEELRASHCGKLPEKLLAPMALAQHARDAQLAAVVAKAGPEDGAVLIAGGGHARLDRAVPYYLRLAAPGVPVLSVAFREVLHAEREALSYVGDEGEFDYVWFTPRASDDDPCAGFGG